MSSDKPLQIFVQPDLDQPIEALLASLAPKEKRQSKTYHTVKGLRQFALSRLAAHDAIRYALGAGGRNVAIEVLQGPNGAPVAEVAGTDDAVGLSLSHAGNMAVACAWLVAQEERYSAGVDIERVRSTEVAHSAYAFSRCERIMLDHVPEGDMIAGLAAWTVKEAVWKALRPGPPTNPAEIEIMAFRLGLGDARVLVGTRLSRLLDNRAIRARVGTQRGPDGVYLLAVAEIAPRQHIRSKVPNQVGIPMGFSTSLEYRGG